MVGSELEKILKEKKLTETEAAKILKSLGTKPAPSQDLHLSNKHIKYGYFSDPHIGHKDFQLPLFDLMIKHFNKEHVEFIITAGDNLEGMSGRPGHVYELEHVGFDAQIKTAADLFNQFKSPIYGIDGNHSSWYLIKADAGVVCGNELELRVKNYHHIGLDSGTLQITPAVKMFVNHPGGGSAYATSYRIQKLIESFDGDSKPNIVHQGHHHRQLYMFTRNVHGFESATICAQTPFMRSKNLAAAMGYGIVDLYVDKGGVNRLVHEFVPHYAPVAKGKSF